MDAPSQKSKDTNSPIFLAITSSGLAAIFAFLMVSQQLAPSWLIAILIPVVGYAFSLVFSVIQQFLSCGAVQIGTVALSNLTIPLTQGFVSGILLLENVPIWKMVFGEFAPSNPVTGLPYSLDSEEYKVGMMNENHYKIQFFSNIVKVALPVVLTNAVKDGLAYFYWVFWLTLLPSYFLLSIQSLCG